MNTLCTPCIVLACIASVSTSAWSVETDDHELAEKDVPAAVLKTMKTAAAEGTKLGDFEHENKDRIEAYTATFHTKAQVEMEITVLPDGTLVSVKQEDDNDTDHHDGDDMNGAAERKDTAGGTGGAPKDVAPAK